MRLGPPLGAEPWHSLSFLCILKCTMPSGKSSRPTYCYINSSSPPLCYWTVKVTWLLVGPVLRDRMSTEYHQHGIPYDFCNSVSSVFRAKLPKILRNFAEFCTAYLDKILLKMWFFMNRISYISKGSHLSRSSTGYCNLQICPCAAQVPLVYTSPGSARAPVVQTHPGAAQAPVV